MLRSGTCGHTMAAEWHIGGSRLVIEVYYEGTFSTAVRRGWLKLTAGKTAAGGLPFGSVSETQFWLMAVCGFNWSFGAESRSRGLQNQSCRRADHVACVRTQ